MKAALCRISFLSMNEMTDRGLTMKTKGLLVLGMLFFTVYPAAAVVVVAPPPVSPATPVNTNSMMGPAAQNSLSTALVLMENAHALLDQAMEQGLDVTEISDAAAKADALIEKAQKIARANPIPAASMLREAVGIYEQAISDLEALLG